MSVALMVMSESPMLVTCAGPCQIPAAVRLARTSGAVPTWYSTFAIAYGGPSPSVTWPDSWNTYGNCATTTGDWNGSTVIAGNTFSRIVVMVVCPSTVMNVPICACAVALIVNAAPAGTKLGTSPVHTQLPPDGDSGTPNADEPNAIVAFTFGLDPKLALSEMTIVI